MTRDEIIDLIIEEHKHDEKIQDLFDIQLYSVIMKTGNYKVVKEKEAKRLVKEGFADSYSRVHYGNHLEWKEFEKLCDYFEGKIKQFNR